MAPRTVEFTDEQKALVVQMASEGKSQFTISQALGVTKRMVAYRCRKQLNEGYGIALINNVPIDQRTSFNLRVQLTDEEEFQITEMAKIGLKVDDIARIMGMGRMTLLANYMELLDKGRAQGHNEVAETLYDMATDGEHPGMTTFYLKAQCGWKEATQIEFPDENGVPQPITGSGTVINITPEKLQAIITVLNEKV